MLTWYQYTLWPPEYEESNPRLWWPLLLIPLQISHTLYDSCKNLGSGSNAKFDLGEKGAFITVVKNNKKHREILNVLNNGYIAGPVSWCQVASACGCSTPAAGRHDKGWHIVNINHKDDSIAVRMWLYNSAQNGMAIDWLNRLFYCRNDMKFHLLNLGWCNIKVKHQIIICIDKQFSH